MQVIKKTIKAVLPRPALNCVIDVRDRLRLAGTPQKPFAPEMLRPLPALSLPAILSDRQAAAGWEEDHAAIARLFGHDDNFGGVNPGDRRAIYYLIMALKPQSVLEVGTHIGASTLYIAAALKRLGRGGKVTTVDIIDVNDATHGSWKKVGMPQSPAGFAAALGLSDHIDFRVGPCQHFMRTAGQRFDLVFLDGDHSAKAVYEELSAALPVLKQDGVILLHDYYPGAKALYPDRATIGGPYYGMKRVRAEAPSIGVLPLGDLPWPTKQGTNATSLALVGKA